MVRPIEQAPVHLLFEDVAVRGGHKVLIEVDNDISMNASDRQGILDKQLRPHPTHLLNIIITTIILNY